jgi:hypothetical protein
MISTGKHWGSARWARGLQCKSLLVSPVGEATAAESRCGLSRGRKQYSQQRRADRGIALSGPLRLWSAVPQWMPERSVWSTSDRRAGCESHAACRDLGALVLIRAKTPCRPYYAHGSDPRVIPVEVRLYKRRYGCCMHR